MVVGSSLPAVAPRLLRGSAAPGDAMNALSHLSYGVEYQCECGYGCFTKWDCDGYSAAVVTDDVGMHVGWCRECDAELDIPGVLVPRWRQCNSRTRASHGNPRARSAWSFTHVCWPGHEPGVRGYAHEVLREHDPGPVPQSLVAA